MQRLRPKSAKQSTKMEVHEQSSLYSKEHEEQEQEQEIEQQRQSVNKRAISSKDKLMSSMYRKTKRETADQIYSKILPRNIPVQKETLYFQTIKLKKQNHKVKEQNVKLKTRIRVLERQNDKLTKAVDVQEDYDRRSKSRITSVINIQSSKIPAMKKLIREARDQVQLLKIQNQKIKKTVKFTRITQLQNQNEVMIEEMTKMTTLIDELTSQQQQQQYLRKQLQQLENFLKIKIQQNQQLHIRNKQLEEDVYKLQQTSKANLQRNIERQKKLQRDLQLNKRRLEQSQKQIGYLKSTLSKQREQKGVKATQLSRNNRNPINKIPQTVSTQPSSDIQKLKQQISNLKKRNQDLEKNNGDLTLTLKTQEEKLKISQNQRVKKEKQLSQEKNRGSQQKVYIDNLNSSIQEYDDDFEEDKKKKTQQQIVDEDDEGQILYQQKPKSKSNSRPKSAKKIGAKKKKSQLNSLLTYRMIAQRYPFDQLKQDIEQTGQTTFKIAQISSMMHNNPFFLNNKQIKQFLKLLDPENHDNPQTSISSSKFISTLKSLISDFQPRDQKQDDQMYIKVAQMVTVYTAQLQSAFQQKKNADSTTITQKTLRQLFKQLQLQKKYIDYIVAELSMLSDDLMHLDYVEFLNKFYIDQQDMGVQQLDEQYEQDNSKTLNKSKKLSQESDSRIKSGKKKKIDR